MRRLPIILVGFLATAAALLGAPQKVSYWVEPCTRPAQTCQPADPQLAEWAFRAWQNASGGELEFNRIQDLAHARIRVFWASGQEGLYGETKRVLVDGQPGAEVYVLPAPLPLNGDRLLRDAIVYLTCVHETGHALGLEHTAVFEDIMYSFQYGGDIPEYFGRYRRKLQNRDDIQKNSGMSESDRKHLLTIFNQ